MRITTSRAAGWVGSLLGFGMLAGTLGFNCGTAPGSGGTGAGTHIEARDSPIVVAGGSIHPITYSARGAGSWTTTTDPSTYHASLNSAGTYGIDYLVLSRFVGSRSKAITGTGGWAITYYDKSGRGTNASAMMVCSDPSCTAATAPASCPTNISQTTTVYVELADPDPKHEHWVSASASELQFLDSVGKDPDKKSCDTGDVETDCEKIHHVVVQSCNNVAGSGSYTCSDAKGMCDVGIGQSSKR